MAGTARKMRKGCFGIDLDPLLPNPNCFGHKACSTTVGTVGIPLILIIRPGPNLDRLGFISFRGNTEVLPFLPHLSTPYGSLAHGKSCNNIYRVCATSSSTHRHPSTHQRLILAPEAKCPKDNFAMTGTSQTDPVLDISSSRAAGVSRFVWHVFSGKDTEILGGGKKKKRKKWLTPKQ